MYGAAAVESLLDSLCECLSRRNLQVPSWTISRDGSVHVASSPASLPTASPASTTAPGPASSRPHNRDSGFEDDDPAVRVETNITPVAAGSFPLLLLYCHFVGTRDRLLLFTDVESLRTYACIISPVAPHLLALLADAFSRIPTSPQCSQPSHVLGASMEGEATQDEESARPAPVSVEAQDFAGARTTPVSGDARNLTGPCTAPVSGNGQDSAGTQSAPVSGDGQDSAGTQPAPVSGEEPASAGRHAPYLVITHLKWTRDWESGDGAAESSEGPGTSEPAGDAQPSDAALPVLAAVERTAGSESNPLGPGGLAREQDARLSVLETHVQECGSGCGHSGLAASTARPPQVQEGATSVHSNQQRHLDALSGPSGQMFEGATSVHSSQEQAAQGPLAPQALEGATSVHNSQEQALQGPSVALEERATSAHNNQGLHVEGIVPPQEVQMQPVRGVALRERVGVAGGARSGGEGESQSREPRAGGGGEPGRLLSCNEVLGAALQAVVAGQQGMEGPPPPATGTVASMDRMFVEIGRMAPFTKQLQTCSVHVWPC